MEVKKTNESIKLNNSAELELNNSDALKFEDLTTPRTKEITFKDILEAIFIKKLSTSEYAERRGVSVAEVKKAEKSFLRGIAYQKIGVKNLQA